MKTLFCLLTLATSPFSFAQVLLSAHSYGVVRFGDRVSVAEKALAQKMKYESQQIDCGYGTFASYPGIYFMVQRGVITRADYAEGSRALNLYNIKLGDPALPWRKQPGVVIKQHHYLDTGHYILLESKDGKSAFLMEDDGEQITAIRAGLHPSVDLVEGCS